MKHWITNVLQILDKTYQGSILNMDWKKRHTSSRMCGVFRIFVFLAIVIIANLNLVTGQSRFNCARSTKSLPGGYSMIEKQGSTVMVLRNNIDKIRAITAYFCEDRPITFLLWAANTQYYYDLYWFYEIPPPVVVPGIRQINFTEEEAVEIPRDLRLSMRVGIHSEDANKTWSILTYFLTTGDSYYLPTVESFETIANDANLEVNSDLPYPYWFTINVCNSHDCPLESVPRDPAKSSDLLLDSQECSNAQSIPSEGKVIIEKSVELTPPGESFFAKAISVYFCRNQSVDAQIWNLVRMFESYNQYELIWSKTIQPRTGDILGEKTVFNFEDGPEIKASHRLGVHVKDPTATIPIATEFKLDFELEQSYDPVSNLNGQRTVDMDTLSWPFKILVEVCPHTDCTEPTTTTTTTTTTPKPQGPDSGSSGTPGGPDGTLPGTPGGPGDTLPGTPGGTGGPGSTGTATPSGPDDTGTGTPGGPGSTGSPGGPGDTGTVTPGGPDDTGSSTPGGPGDTGTGTPGSSGGTGSGTTDGPDGTGSGTSGGPGDNGTGTPGAPGTGTSFPGQNPWDWFPRWQHDFRINQYTIIYGPILGPEGPMGPDGLIGLQGPIGMKGEKGERGSQGTVQGPKGNPGYGGVKGIRGDRGANGFPGNYGDRGAVGVSGLDGLKGIKGQRGDQGPPGLPGLNAVFSPQNDNQLRTASSKDSECKCETLQNPTLILGLLVWTILLTILLIVIIFIAARNQKREREYEYSHSQLVHSHHGYLRR